MTAIGSVVGGQESFSLNFLSSQWPQKHDSSLKLSKLIQYVLKINPFQRSGGLEGRRQKQWKIVILVFDWLYFAIAAWPVIEKGARPTTQMTKMSIVLLAYWKPIIVSLQLWLVPWNTLYMFIVKVHLHFLYSIVKQHWTWARGRHLPWLWSRMMASRRWSHSSVGSRLRFVASSSLSDGPNQVR